MEWNQDWKWDGMRTQVGWNEDLEWNGIRTGIGME